MEISKFKFFNRYILLGIVFLFCGFFIFLNKNNSNENINVTSPRVDNNLQTIFERINQEGKNWSADAQIEFCSTSDFDSNYNIKQLGCNIYSQSLNQTRLAVWNTNMVSLSTPVSLGEEYRQSALSKKNILDISNINISISQIISEYINKYPEKDFTKLEFMIDYSTHTKFDQDSVAKIRFIATNFDQAIYVDLKTGKNIEIN